MCYHDYVEPIPPIHIQCPFCSAPIEPTAFFCPVCGKSLKEKPLPKDLSTQVGLYLASIFLVPFFLGRTIKYMKSTDEKARHIGLISLGLTIVELIVVIWLSVAITKNITREVNQQINQYQNLSF
jgi:L-lactate permease